MKNVPLRVGETIPYEKMFHNMTDISLGENNDSLPISMEDLAYTERKRYEKEISHLRE